jgi:hypothetical protein
MFQPNRRPVADGLIEILPVDLLTSGAGTFTFLLDSIAGRVLARHAGLGIDSIGNLIAQVQLPDDFERFETDAVKIITKRNGNTDSLIITLNRDGTPDSTINSVDIRAVVNATYETKLLTPGTEYSTGDILIFLITSTCDPLESQDVAGIWGSYIRRP